MSFQVRQSPSKVELLAAVQNSNHLQIESQVVDHLVRNFEVTGLKQGDPIIIISAIGEPSAGKTGILNGLLNRLGPHPTTAAGLVDFPVPKNFQEQGHKFDGILAGPPLVIQWQKDGARLGVLMLDIWNNSRMSEDVYIKLVEFSFQVSSLQIYSLSNPLRPIQWWNGRSSFAASSIPELRRPVWKNVTMEWSQPSFTSNSQHQLSQQAHLIAISAPSGQTGLFQVSMMPADGNERGVTVSENCFEFIMKQVMSVDNYSCRLSALKSHLMSSGRRSAANSSVQIPITCAVHSSHQESTGTRLGDPSAGNAGHIEFVKKASKIALDYVKEHLLKHLTSHGILTNADILAAFNFLMDKAKCVSSSIPGLDLSRAVWDTAWKSLQSSVDECLDQARLTNRNAIRRWDKALESALEKANKFYNDQMTGCLPNCKISPEQLDKYHHDCIQKTVKKFNVPPEISQQTIDYYIQILLKSKSEEWREGNRLENETKDLASEFKETGSRTTAPSQPSPAHLKSLAACSVGIYFGPDAVVFKAHTPDGAGVPFQLQLKPYIAFCNGKIALGDDAVRGHQQPAAMHYDVFDILTNLGTAPSLLSSDSVEINGQNVCVTAEAAAVLFFREAIKKVSATVGRRVQSCAVAVPGLLPRGALTAIKAALDLAGFSNNVTLLPISNVLAMALAQSSPDENLGELRKPKKVLTIYHTGAYLEVALTHLWNGKLETQDLAGYVNLLRLRDVNLSAVTETAIKNLKCKDLSAIVALFGNQVNPTVEAAVVSAVNDLSSIKNTWGQTKACIPTERKSPRQVADQAAEFNATTGVSSASGGMPSTKRPQFQYYYPHEIEVIGKRKEKVPAAGRYEYVHKAGSSGFHICEQGNGSQWVYNFVIGPEARSGQACEITLLPDGSFHIGTLGHSTGPMVHCSASKLLTTWDQETVQKNVDRVMQAMMARTVELGISPQAEVSSSAVKPGLQNSRDRLSQLLRSVEQVLGSPGLEDDDPIHKHVRNSLDEYKSILQNPSASVMELNSAIDKLELQKDMLD